MGTYGAVCPSALGHGKTDKHGSGLHSVILALKFRDIPFRLCCHFIS